MSYPAPTDVKAHLPDLSTSEGWLTIFTLGNLVFLGNALDIRHYDISQDIPAEEEAEIIFHREKYQKFISRLDAQYQLEYDGRTQSIKNTAKVK